MPSNKINFYLKSFKKYYSGRKILIAKEITKIHETFFRGKVDNLKLFKNHIKGELTIVMSENIIKGQKFNEENYLKNRNLNQLRIISKEFIL